jgi:preprotein translocase subunit SecF
MPQILKSQLRQQLPLIVGYSINDTIVTFDRVRENLHKIKVITKPEQIDYNNANEKLNKLDAPNIKIATTTTITVKTVLTERVILNQSKSITSLIALFVKQ